MRRAATTTLLLLAGLGTAGAAGAQTPELPSLTASLRLELQDDWRLSGEGPGDGSHHPFATLELGLEARLAGSWSADVGVVLEPVREPEPAQSELFGGHGVFVETLALRYAGERWSARVGRFTPRFGVAWDAAAGLYGRDFAEDYELAERWGLEAALEFGGQSWGSHELGASVFSVDTSPLSGSLLTDRGRVRRFHGGPGNTGRPDSFVVSLDGSAPGPDGLRYHASFVQQGRGRGDRRTERGLALGVSLPFALPAEFRATAFVEHARIFHAGGVPGDAQYLTSSLELSRGRCYGAIGFALRKTSGGGSGRDRFLEVSGGCRIGLGLDLAIAWRAGRDGGVETHGLGLRSTRAFHFGP